MSKESKHGNRTAKKALNRRFLLTAIALLGLLILSSLAVIVLILTEPQTNLSAYQPATSTPTRPARSVEASSTPSATAAGTRLAPSATATPQVDTNPASERIVDYRENSDGAHRIIRYAGTLEGTHRIVSYDGIVVEGLPTPEETPGAAETPQQGRIIFYGKEE